MINKIDLHVHTKSIKSYDTKDYRNIDASNFARIMKNSNVKYIGITNHNTFDIEQYNEFKTIEGLLVFPGIEVDILINDDPDYKNMNLIFNPEYANQLDLIVKKWNNSKYKINGLDELVQTFDELSPIYFCDQKAKEKRKVPIDTIKQLKLKTENPVLVDSKKENTNLILGFNDIYALVASDNMDWKNYENESIKLGNVNWNIESFDELHKLLKYDHATFKILFDKKHSQNIEVDIAKDKFNIKIVEGLNIIFGGKGTGKTQIIEGIKKHCESNNLSNSYYKSSDKAIKFDEYFPEEFNLNVEHCVEFAFLNKNLNFLQNYSEEKNVSIISISEFYKAAKNISGFKYKLFLNKNTIAYKPTKLRVC